MRLKDQIAVITGGAHGIGLGITKRLADEGAATIIGDLDLEGALRAAREIASRGGHGCVARRLDVRDSVSVDETLDWTVREFGRVDILVNNAGVHLVKPITEY